MIGISFTFSGCFRLVVLKRPLYALSGKKWIVSVTRDKIGPDRRKL